MLKKKIDLTPFIEDISEDNILRNIFFNDYELQKAFVYLNNHNPISLPEIVRGYNNIFKKNYDKRWFDFKLKKIEHFGLFEKKSVEECNPNTPEDKLIIKKHKELLIESNMPPQLHNIYNKTKYYNITEKGSKWVDIIAEQMKRRVQK